MSEALAADVAARSPRCVWLDGGGGRDWSGHRSVVAWCEPGDVSLTYAAARREVLRHTGDGRPPTVVGDDVFEALAAEAAGGGGGGRWFGYLGYAARPDLPATPDPHLPDAVWLRPSRVRELPHAPGDMERYPANRGSLHFQGTGMPWKYSGTRGAGYRDIPPRAYRAAFEQVQEHLQAGNSYEVNLTRRVERACADDPMTVYRRLRRLNPAPYAGFVQHDVDGARAWLLSSSPERFARITGGELETRPIKGTTARHDDPGADARARHALATEPRFRAENLMIVDLLRHDLAQVCEVGSVAVPELMAVESYASVHQLVSTVRGRLRADVGTLDAIRALFPAGSMTGAPKRRTMEIVDDVEETPRGAYAGAFGWLDVGGPGHGGGADLGVVIRSLTTAGDGVYRLGTGGGITVHSDVESEWTEAELKAERVLRALRPLDR